VPNGRRSDLVNRRDLEVLDLIARYGTVSRQVAALWAGCGRTVAYERERRLRLAGLIQIHPGPGPGERLLLATRTGLRACGHPELPTARLSLATLRHETAMAAFGARLELAGETMLSEREIVAAERAEGKRIYSADLGHGRVHRADLLRLAADGPEAIELELTAKGARRLDALLRAWRFAVAEGRLSRVVYQCPPKTRGLLERAVTRTSTSGAIEIVGLDL
jgi:hypothetical protein